MTNGTSNKRLGRGLAALIGNLDQPVPARAPDKTGPDRSKDNHGRGERLVAIELIRANPNNPRRNFPEPELRDLVESIREHGIVQPILVRPISGEDLAGASFEIIAGERRWRAAQKAALHEIPVVIRDVADKQALEIAIIENVQRTDLNPVEEAQGYQQLIDEYDYSQNDLARAISKSRSHVANTMRLLKLPEGVLKLVREGALSAGHARTLVTIANPEKLARKIIAEGLSVRQVEAISQSEGMADLETKGMRSGKPATAAKSADIQAVERRLEEALGLKIDLRHGDKTTGELRIKYKTLEQLDDLCRRLESGL